MRALIFCTTCRHSGEEKIGPDGLTGGERLARHAEDALAAAGRDDIAVKRQECLWSCQRHCNVWLYDAARFSYLAGDFAPERASAEAIIQWFDMHGASEAGWVAFRQWPQAMRGHFIARLPPALAVDQP